MKHQRIGVIFNVLFYLTIVLIVQISTANAALPCGDIVCIGEPEMYVPEVYEDENGNSYYGKESTSYFYSMKYNLGEQGIISVKAPYEIEDIYNFKLSSHYTLNANDALPAWIPVYESKARILDFFPSTSAPSFDRLKNGKLVVVYFNYSIGTTNYKLFDIYNEADINSSSPFIIDSHDLYYSTSLTGNPQVTALADGSFVVVWGKSDVANPFKTQLYMQRFDGNGIKIGAEQLVTDGADTVYYKISSIAPLSDGGFIVVGESKGNMFNSASSIFARQYSVDGMPKGPQFHVDTGVSGKYNAVSPSAIGLDNERFLIVWIREGITIDSTLATTTDHGIYIYTSDLGMSSETANTTKLTGGLKPNSIQIRRIKDNNLIVAWGTEFRAGSPFFTTNADKSYARYIRSDGVPVAQEFVSDSNGPPFLQPLSNGDFWFGTPYAEPPGSTEIPINGTIAKRYSGSSSGAAEKLSFTFEGKVIELIEGGIIGFDIANTLRIVDSKRVLDAWWTDIVVTPQIDLRFRVEDKVTGDRWFSSTRTYVHAPENDGAGGSVDYLHGYTNKSTAIVNLGMNCVSCDSLQLFNRKAPLFNSSCGVFSAWSPYGNSSTLKQQLSVGLDNASCFQYKAVVTNVYDIETSYVNSNTLKVDLTPPALSIVSDDLTGNKLTIDVSASDSISGLQATTYQVNNDPEVPFFGNSFNAELPEGESRIQIRARDLALNTASIERFYNVNINTPAITIYGVEEGNVYGDDIDFVLDFTIPLTDVVILVDGQPRSNLSGLPDGPHTLEVTGRNSQGNIVSKLVNFTIDRSLFSINLLSPQARIYNTKSISIQYNVSQSVSKVWYTLNGGPEKEGLTLNDLSDGNHTLKLFATMENGKTASVTRQFSVKEAIPSLNVSLPENGKTYANNRIAVNFSSNSEVTYRLGELTGTIKSGTSLVLPQDGEHSLLLTATHPVSGSSLSRRINFFTDSTLPIIELLSPRPTLYSFDEIPIQYKSNKTLKNVRMFLDDQPVTTLSDVSPGLHNFRIEADDLANRTVVGLVQFSVSRVNIIQPIDGAQIISDQYPPVLPFIYESEGTFTDLTVAIDSGSGQRINQPPGTEIPLYVSPGNHELTLRGRLNEFSTAKRAKFNIGTNNISVGADSIDYQYSGCSSEFTACNVDVTLKIDNVGDFDINQSIMLRFDHITSSGFQTENYTVGGLSVGESASVSLPIFRASLGDTFSITVDPYAQLNNEWPADNGHQIIFEAGQISDVDFQLSLDSAYLEGVTVFDLVTVKTAGPVERIEYSVGDWTFVDNTAHDGFVSIVDMGLMSPRDNCVRIVAYGVNQVALDSRIQCFNIKNIDLEPVNRMRLFWSAYSSGSNYIFTSQIDKKQLAIDLANTRYQTLRSDSAVVATLKEDGGVMYRVLTNPAATQGRPVSRSAGLGDAPIVGDNVPIPNGHGIFITSLDLASDTCSADAAIPILTRPRSKELDELLAAELAEINDVFLVDTGLNPIEEILLRLVLSTVGIPTLIQFDTGKTLKDIAGDLPSWDIGITYLGWTWVQLPDNQLIKTHVNGHQLYGFDPDSQKCLVRTEQDGNIELVLKSSYQYEIKDSSFNIATGGFSVRTVGVPIIDIKDIPVLPLGIVSAKVKIFPQNLVVPLEMGVKVDMAIIDKRLYLGPAHSRFRVSVNHHSRVAEVEAQAYPFILLGFGAGMEIIASLHLDGIGKADWIGGSNDDKTFKHLKFDGKFVIKNRVKYCFVGICKKGNWNVSTPYEKQQENGTLYTDEEVDAALALIEPFRLFEIEDLIALGLYYIVTGDGQATEELLACGAFQSLTANMSQSPLYANIGQSCKIIQSPDAPGEVSTFYSDPTCQVPVSYKPTSFLDYCKNNLLENNKTFIGNADAWENDGDPAYVDIGKNSRWTLSHGPRLDVWGISQDGNRRPFLKKAQYRNINGCALEMRVFKQNILGQNLKPLMFIHGGAWKFRGFGAIGMESAISHLTERGYVVFSPFYRLMGSSDGPAACQNTLGEDIVTDVEAALQWVKNNGATLGAASGPITLVGQSAGAHLASWLAVNDEHSADIRKSLLFYPPTDFEDFVLKTASGGQFDGRFPQAENLTAQFFGYTDIDAIDRNNLPKFIKQNGIPRRVSEGAPFAPLFMIHGNQDSLVPVESATRMCDAVAGRPFNSTPTDGGTYPCGSGSKLSIIDGADHILDMKCFIKGIDASVLKKLQSHIVSFDAASLCPVGFSGAEQARSAIKSALQWLE